ncbi:DUF5333 domain-containing protein [Roseobacteraceae bacterium S113]
MKRLMCVMALLAGPAVALPPLADVERVTTGLRDARVADEIRKACDDISARWMVALREGNKLKSYATDLGYSEEQIEDFMGSKAARNQINALADAYMRRNGVETGNKASYCALGRAEIASESQIGSLLRER